MKIKLPWAADRINLSSVYFESVNNKRYRYRNEDPNEELKKRGSEQ